MGKEKLQLVRLTDREKEMSIQALSLFYRTSKERVDEESIILEHQLKLLINKFKLATPVDSEKALQVEIKKDMKNKTIAVLLALFLGGLGIHKFYLGENKNGVLYLLFCWTYIPAIFALIEGLQMMTMSKKKFDEKFNK